MIITIDGPVASGKTTVAHQLAAALGFYYVGSGILYRALAHLLRTHCAYTAMDEVRQCDVDYLLAPKNFVYTYDVVHSERLFFQGQELAISNLRTPAVAHDASQLATLLIVRRALGAVQRAIAQSHDLVVEGRDAGSVVFVDAAIKFFITASVHERARRWQRDQIARGISLTVSDAVRMVEQRDLRDKSREIDPLIIPEGAIILDTTDLDAAQVIARLQYEIKQKA